MKYNYIFKVFLTFGFIMLLINLAECQNQSKNNEKLTKAAPENQTAVNQDSKTIDYNILPEGFPKLVDTGNPEKDLENYNLAKDKWYNEHPDYLQKKQNAEKSQKYKVSKSEYSSLPDYKRKEIDSNPEKYIIE